MRGVVVVSCFALLFSLVGCTGAQKGAVGGGVLGAGAGAIIGHQSGRAGEGAAIGGVAGALTGALAGDYLEDQKGKARREGYEAGRRDTERAQGNYESDYRR